MGNKPLAAIAGIGWTDYTRNSGKSIEALALEACWNAIEDAGVAPEKVDGIVSFSLGDSVSGAVIATDLALPQLNHFADIAAGGNMACGVVLEAAMAVALGQADYVLVFRALNGASGRRYGGAEFSRLLEAHCVHSDSEAQFLDPAGVSMPAQHFALVARRHMERYGTTNDDLGAVAVSCRANAADNPRAMMRKPLTIEDYHKSPWIAEPFHVFDCCLQSDGACALLVTSVERARDLKKPVVPIRAGFTGMGPNGRGAMWANYVTDHPTCYAEQHADRLFKRADISRKDLDFAEIYDCFTISLMSQMEGFGLVEKGGVGEFFRSGAGRIGGRLPINTAGGLLSEAYIHGLNHVVEAVSQLRGEAGPRQVKDAELGLVTAGGSSALGSAMVLGRLQ